MKSNFVVNPNSQRRLRRHIQRALTGAALGAGLITVPAYAATYTVTTTADSGLGSLRQAIIDANTNPGNDVVEIAPGLVGQTFTINSPLPAVASDTEAYINQNVSIQSTFLGSDGSYINLADHSSITGAVTLNDDAELYLDNGSFITGNVIVNNDAGMDIDDGGIGDNSYVIGNVTLNHSAYLDMSDGGAYITGNVIMNDDAYAELWDDSYITGAVTLNDDSDMELYYDSFITGNVITNDYSEIELYDDSYITGAVTLNDDSYMYLDEDSYITGDVTLNGNSEMDLYDDSYITGNVTLNNNDDDGGLWLDDYSFVQGDVNVNNGAQLDIENDSYVTGNVTLNDSGYLDMDDFSYIEGNVTLNDSSKAELNYYSSILGEVIANGTSKIKLYDSSYIDNDVTANDSAHVRLDYSSISGNVLANDNSIVRAYQNSTIEGDAVANDHAFIVLKRSDIWGDVTLNDYSLLRNQGNSELNDSSGTTTFGSNATFAPNLNISNPGNTGVLTVNTLNAGEATLQPWWVDNETYFNVGDSFKILEYNSKNEDFNPNVLSPLDFIVDTSNPNEISLVLDSNHVDLNKLPGSENSSSFGRYLSNVINDSQTGTDLDLAELPGNLLPFFASDIIRQAAHDGNLNYIEAGMPDNYSAHNMQAYWNQKSFVESIQANLQNDRNSAVSPAGSFGLNQSSGIGQAPVQLASLRQAMTSNIGALNYAGSGSNASNVWASYNGNRQHTDADGDVGSHDWRSSTNGFTVGYTAGGDRFSWGVAAGHQDSDLDVDGLGASGTQRGWNAGIYGALKGKRSYLNGVLGYGNYKNETFGSFGDSTFDNKALSASLEIGKHLSTDKKGGFTPFASVLWTRIKQDATVIDPYAGILLTGSNNSVFTTELGLRYNHRMFDESDSLKGGWQAGVSWLHQGGDTGLGSNFGFAGVGGSYAVKSTPLAGNSLRVQLGAYGRIHGNLIGFAGYQGTFGSSQKINAVNAGIGYQF